MVRMCEKCLGVYQTVFLKSHEDGIYNCPNAECGHPELIAVDDQLVDIVVDFYKLGLPTKYCCSGHAYTVLFNPYIRFELATVKLANMLYTDLLDFKAENKALSRYCHVSIKNTDVGRFLDLEAVRNKDSGKHFDIDQRMEIQRGFVDFVRAFIKRLKQDIAAKETAN